MRGKSNHVYQHEYAMLISRSSYGTLERAFITERFTWLHADAITMSDTVREWKREQELPKKSVLP